MKKLYSLLALTACITLVIAVSSCKKGDPAIARPKEQLIVGKWSINRIQLKVYYGGALVKDSIAVQKPLPENYVLFNANGTLEYKFNKSTADAGTYTFVGSDSVYAVIAGETYKWKNLLLTETNFNVVNTSASPAYPGGTLDTYQTFVR